jgi:hypothetical protein
MCFIYKDLYLKDKNHKAWAECCLVRLSERALLRQMLENRPYLYHTTVAADRRPAAEVPATSRKKPGRSRSSTLRATDQIDTDEPERGAK